MTPKERDVTKGIEREKLSQEKLRRYISKSYCTNSHPHSQMTLKRLGARVASAPRPFTSPAPAHAEQTLL
jgi:hypothetical protein